MSRQTDEQGGHGEGTDGEETDGGPIFHNYKNYLLVKLINNLK